jgi:hypothetical protein
MSRYVITNDETKVTKKLLKKFPDAEISVHNERLKGSFKITHYRKYVFREEVDIEFNGELFAMRSSLDGRKWHKSDIYNERCTSKIKVNKMIRRSLFNEVKHYCAYFGISLRYAEDLKKVKWV